MTDDENRKLGKKPNPAAPESDDECNTTLDKTILNKIADKAKSSHPAFDNIQIPGIQAWGEVDYVKHWAKEMNRRDPSKQICVEGSNPEDPPDVFAKMNGERVGIEVTRLVEDSNGEPQTYWSLDQFRERLEKSIQEKDGKTPRAGCLHKQLLLIAVDGLNLPNEETLAEYLRKIELPPPQNFDVVYVIGRHVSVDLGEGYYPIHEVRLLS